MTSKRGCSRCGGSQAARWVKLDASGLLHVNRAAGHEGHAPCHAPHPLQRKAAEQLGVSDEELDERLHRLLLLLPDLRQKLASMRPQLVAALAAQIEQIPGARVQASAEGSVSATMNSCGGGVRRMRGS